MSKDKEFEDMTKEEILSSTIGYKVVPLEWINPEFLSDRAFMVEMLNRNKDSLEYASDEIKELVGNTDNPAAKLQSLIEKEALEAKMAARGIKINKERDNDVGFAL